MPSFFLSLYKLSKPINKLHIAAYFILICFSIYDRAFLPPSEKVEDYTKIEGTLLSVSSGDRRSSGYVRIRVKNSSEIIGFKYDIERRSIYRQWLNQDMTAYYWPSHGFALDNRLVYMAPITEHERYFHERHFKRKFGMRGLVWIFTAFFILWFVPLTYRLNSPKHK